MAKDLLIEPVKTKLAYHHDLESLFYVLVYFCICTPLRGSSKTGSNTAVDLEKIPIKNWFLLEDYESQAVAVGKRSGKLKFKDVCRSDEFASRILDKLHSSYDSLKPRLSQLRSLVFLPSQIDQIENRFKAAGINLPMKFTRMANRDPLQYFQKFAEIVATGKSKNTTVTPFNLGVRGTTPYSAAKKEPKVKMVAAANDIDWARTLAKGQRMLEELQWEMNVATAARRGEKYRCRHCGDPECMNPEQK